jgi:hypothetical protein
MPTTPIKPKQQDFESEPISLWELGRRKRGLDPASAEIEDAVPKLPPTSPWAASIDEICGTEPPIDGTSEATININSEDQA